VQFAFFSPRAAASASATPVKVAWSTAGAPGQVVQGTRSMIASTPLMRAPS